MQRPVFPARTIILMILTLLAFGWFWWQTHHEPAPPEPVKLPATIVPVEITRGDGGA